jgi:predicted Zn-dependent protease
MKRLLAVAAVAAVLMSFSPQASAAPCCYEGWHWKRSHNPFTVTVLSSATNTWATPLARAAAEWSKSSKLNIRIVQGNKSSATRQACVETRGEVHFCNGNYGNTGWSGLTEATLSGQHIVRIRIRVNDANTPAHFRRLISCHELGHSLGLAHNTRPTSCMRPGAGSTPHPDATDFAELNAIYRHLDRAASRNTGTRTIRVAWR